MTEDARLDAFGCLISIGILIFVVAVGYWLLFEVAAPTWFGWQADLCVRSFPSLETRWDWWIGCQVLTEEGWVPAKNYRVL